MIHYNRHHDWILHLISSRAQGKHAQKFISNALPHEAGTIPRSLFFFIDILYLQCYRFIYYCNAVIIRCYRHSYRHCIGSLIQSAGPIIFIDIDEIPHCMTHRVASSLIYHTAHSHFHIIDGILIRPIGAAYIHAAATACRRQAAPAQNTMSLLNAAVMKASHWKALVKFSKNNDGPIFYIGTAFILFS